MHIRKKQNKMLDSGEGKIQIIIIGQMLLDSFSSSGCIPPPLANTEACLYTGSCNRYQYRDFKGNATRANKND